VNGHLLTIISQVKSKQGKKKNYICTSCSL